LRVGRLNDDYLLAFDRLDLDFLLLAGLQFSAVLGFLPHALHSIHHFGLLLEDGIAQILGPLEVAVEELQGIRKCH